MQIEYLPEYDPEPVLEQVAHAVYKIGMHSREEVEKLARLVQEVLARPEQLSEGDKLAAIVLCRECGKPVGARAAYEIARPLRYNQVVPPRDRLIAQVVCRSQDAPYPKFESYEPRDWTEDQVEAMDTFHSHFDEAAEMRIAREAKEHLDAPGALLSHFARCVYVTSADDGDAVHLFLEDMRDSGQTVEYLRLLEHAYGRLRYEQAFPHLKAALKIVKESSFTARIASYMGNIIENRFRIGHQLSVHGVPVDHARHTYLASLLSELEYTLDLARKAAHASNGPRANPSLSLSAASVFFLAGRTQPADMHLQSVLGAAERGELSSAEQRRLERLKEEMGYQEPDAGEDLFL